MTLWQVYMVYMVQVVLGCQVAVGYRWWQENYFPYFFLPVGTDMEYTTQTYTTNIVCKKNKAQIIY